YAGEIVEEARKANIQFVPTVIVGSHIFDESISADELTQLINE
ncbi:MAG: thioredoxin domain-containing protein, partial [Enterococcus gallinarum]|nr:thioredoxin domain-containing protein [Enterococcus gallinarum]